MYNTYLTKHLLYNCHIYDIIVLAYAHDLTEVKTGSVWHRGRCMFSHMDWHMHDISTRTSSGRGSQNCSLKCRNTAIITLEEALQMRLVILLFYRSFLVQYELIYDVHQQNSTFAISVPALINTLHYIYIHSTISVGNMGLMIRSFIFAQHI